MSPSPKMFVKDEEEGLVKAAAVKDEQPEHRKYKWLVALFMAALLLSFSDNAGLTIAIVTKTVGILAQKHVYAVSLTSELGSANKSVVAKVPRVEVAEAIASIQNRDSGTATTSAGGEAASFCSKMLQQITPVNYSTLLQAEVKSYEQSAKFRNKIDELNGRKKVNWDAGGRIGEIATALRKVVDKSVHSILDLGAGPGLITRYAQQLAAKVHGPSGGVRIEGVELVHGWVSAARDFASTRPIKGTHFHFQQADITNISLGATYDLIYMADSIEHVPEFRRGALWQVLAAHSHTGSRLYLHFPNVKKQLAEQRRQHTQAHISIGKASRRRLQQYFEEVVELNDVVKAGCCVGFRTKHYKDHGNGKSGFVSIHMIREETALLRDCRKSGPRAAPGE